METIFILVRHGSHDRLGSVLCGRMAGVRLSAQGRAEADALADRLSSQRLIAVLSSPLERAIETATPIAERQGLPLTIEPALNELDLGAWSGRRFEELHGDPAWDLWNRARSHGRPTPGETPGESMAEAQTRIAALLDRLRRAHPGGRLALVSHGDIIKAALAHAMGLPLDFHGRFEISPASRSVIIAGDWGLKVHSINEGAA
ncbi:putative phosphoglycerate mutase [Azospirillum lipoferum]|uniref:Histidine phosphatase family protein n=1 Tax=Azospirillum lipoferum TaxID=193 RepID=A0A5A9GBS2_AZOLI|nr:MULTISPECIES: histidine phosphatase family protein [Azospirillum]KAA0591883.1 histidine phosphatase family protein [Azospirillum lipoferum]MCP1614677.1 putative phosphoglycerate mutase [Azospirillum lipoferum]MDW5537487.1 histidine phosphatase family protein [Azospirillum sp. NL1]